MSIFWGTLLNPTKGLLKNHLKNNPDGWLNKLVFIWYPSVIFIPVIIIGFAVAGYYLSALQLQEQLIISLRLILLMIIIHQIVICWLTSVNRQLASNNATQKFKTLSSIDKSLAGSEDPVLPVTEQIIDIPKINAQTIKLLNVFIVFTLIIGFFMIWKNIMPAFSFLEGIVLWQHLVNIDNQESYQPITLMNLLLAGLYIFIVAVSVRNFFRCYGVIGFRRLSIEVGGRYAVNQLAKYI
jgi:Small-conductance mechanosensitive channel